VLDSKEQIAALDLYAKLLRQYAPPGVVNFNWYECSASFMQGQVAIYMDGVNFASQFEDAAKSKVVGKVGYAVLPSGPGGHFSPIYITGMAVSSRAAARKPHTSSPSGRRTRRTWCASSCRCRRRADLDLGQRRGESEAQDAGRDWYQAYQASLKIGRQGLPEIVRRHRVPRHHRCRDPEGDRRGAGRSGARAGAEGLSGPAQPTES